MLPNQNHPPRHDRAHAPVGAVLTAAALLGAVLLGPSGCTQDRRGERLANAPPQVRLTGGPHEGERTSYRTRVYWTGWDDDGVIEHYEVAIDPPEVFSEEEIARPEDFPELSIRRILGPLGGDDTLRVAKTVDGARHSFDYLRTRDTDRIFVFSASETDSFYYGGQLKPLETSSDMHVVYLRAMDNEGAYSDIDRLAFTAWTYAPTAWVTFPDTRSRQWLNTGAQVKVEFFGFDPDPPSGSGLPAGFLYKLVNLDKLEQDRTIYREYQPSLILYHDTPDIPWKYQPVEDPQLTFNLPPGQYVFGVRAVDATGAVEPFLDWQRRDEPGNAFKFASFENGGIPELNISEENYGIFNYRGRSGAYHEIEVPVKTPLKFRWNGSAEEYGGRILSYSWGVDVPDLERDGPNSGWSPWGQTTTVPEPLVFRNPGRHTFYVRALDTGGHVQIAALSLVVFDTPMNRQVMFIDDYLENTHPLDWQQDEWWRTLMTESGLFDPAHLDFEDMWFETGGESDTKFFENEAPRLIHLGKYETLIWSVHGAGWCGHTGLLQDTALRNVLASYLRLGGKLWLVGPMSMSATKRSPLDCNDPSSPFHDPGGKQLPATMATYPFSFEPGDFAQEFFKVGEARIRNDKGTSWENSMVGVRAWDEADEDPEFPSMMADPDKFHPIYWNVNAITHSEAFIDPVFGNTTHDGDLDSLYAYVAAREVRPDRFGKTYNTPYSGKLCALRWHDPDPDREHGRVMWFGFPFYYMEDDRAMETFRAAISWFQEEERIPPAD